MWSGESKWGDVEAGTTGVEDDPAIAEVMPKLDGVEVDNMGEWEPKEEECITC